MLIYRVHSIGIQILFLFHRSSLHLLHSTWFDVPLSLFYSVKRRISSAVRNLQILFQLHPGKRSFSPVPAGKTACATLKTRPIVEFRVGRANFHHLDNSCERSTEERKKEGRKRCVTEKERERVRENCIVGSLQKREKCEKARGEEVCSVITAYCTIKILIFPAQKWDKLHNVIIPRKIPQPVRPSAFSRLSIHSSSLPGRVHSSRKNFMNAAACLKCLMRSIQDAAGICINSIVLSIEFHIRLNN